MMRQDYILRMIDELGQAWALVVGRMRAGQYEEALGDLDGAARRHVGLSLRLVGGLSSEQLLRMLRTGSALDRGRCVALAELLRQEAEVLDLQGRPGEATASRLKALDVFFEVHDAYEGPRLAERRDAMEAMIRRLEATGLPAASLAGLARYHEASGRWADAEDALHELLEESRAHDGDAWAAALDEGIAFYERLRARGDAELEAGGLPGDEVEEGLQELLALREETGEQARSPEREA
jgi:tetratricopeptide (TPR) repeat protein